MSPGKTRKRYPRQEIPLAMISALQTRSTKRNVSWRPFRWGRR